MLWADLRAAVASASARAWIFRSLQDEARVIEFIEWQGEAGSSIFDAAAVRIARTALDTAIQAEASETWQEAEL